MTSPTPNTRHTSPRRIGIGLWGATASGKTTLLGALKLATQQTRSGQVAWTVTSRDARAVSVMAQLSNTLVVERSFPAGTLGNTPLSWSFLGEKRRNGRSPADRVEFTLDLLDVPGILFADAWHHRGPELVNDEDVDFDDVDFDDSGFGRMPGGSADAANSSDSAGSGGARGASADDRAALVEHLARCDGIILLFDPVREEQERDSYQHFNAMLDTVVARAHAAGRITGVTLPHHLSVCITKFDDPRVLESALRPDELAALANTPGQPKIDRKIAARYFDELCERRTDGTARYVRDGIRGVFRPDRVRYYATSSIGFFVAPGGRFDPADYSNVVMAEGKARIRGDIRPMNVLEPIASMVGRINRSSRVGAGA